jgi:hypothetical protein
MSDSNYRRKFIDVINTFGSIASITGISLLWLKGNTQIDIDTVLMIPIIALVVSFSLGVLALVYIVVEYFYRKYTKGKGLMVNVAYFCLIVPALIFILIFVVRLGDKIDLFRLLR